MTRGDVLRRFAPNITVSRLSQVVNLLEAHGLIEVERRGRENLLRFAGAGPSTVEAAPSRVPAPAAAEKAHLKRQISTIETALGLTAGLSRVNEPRSEKRMPAATRKAIGQRMKAYWAKRRAAVTKREARLAK